MKAKLAEKEHLSVHAQRVQEERDKLKEKVRDMERASSEQQAKILMSAFTEAKSGAGLGGPSTSLLSTQSAGTGD